MSENLYAPPQAELESAASRAQGGGDFDFGLAFSQAWSRTWANFPLWLAAVFVYLLAMLASAVTIVGIFLAIPVLYWGVFAFSLKMHDGGARLGDLFSGFSRYGQALGGMFGFFLVSMLVGLVGQAPLLAAQALDGGPAMLIGGYAIYLGFSLLVTPRLSMAPFLMVDRGMGLGEALQLAWDRTGPILWKLAGLVLVAIPIMIAGALAFLVGMIPATVVLGLMWVSAYRQIFGGAPQPAA